MVDASCDDIGVVLVAGIGMHPGEIVHQAAGGAQVGEREILVLHLERSRTEPTGGDDVARKGRAGKRVENGDRPCQCQQLRKIAGALGRCGHVRAEEGMSRHALAVPQPVEERLVLDDGAGAAQIEGVIELAGLLFFEKAARAEG